MLLGAQFPTQAPDGTQEMLNESGCLKRSRTWSEGIQTRKSPFASCGQLFQLLQER